MAPHSDIAFLKESHLAEKTPQKCSLCDKSNYRTVYSQLPFEIVRCSLCGMGFLTPVPTERFLAKFYSKKYFQKESEGFGYKNYKRMRKVLEAESLRKIEFIKKFIRSSSTLLDVGSGLGFFANSAFKKGFKVSILDRSAWAVSYAMKKYKIPGYVSDFTPRSVPQSKFEVVTAWDVLEHLANPKDGFLAINRVLDNGGLVFITTPNIESWDARIMGKRWYGFTKIPEHIQYFSPATIKKFAVQAGFEVVAIKSWGFVRDFKFIADKSKSYSALLSRLLTNLLKLFNLERKHVYFPFIDMMVVLKKEKDF